MKPFKQKVEEKRKRLEVERLIVEEKAFKIQQQKEDDRLEQERLDKIEHDKRIIREEQIRQERIWQDQDRKKRQEEDQKRIQEAREWELQIQSHEQKRTEKQEFRLGQKDAIKDILSHETQIREDVKAEIDAYEDEQLQKIEETNLKLEQERPNN